MKQTIIAAVAALLLATPAAAQSLEERMAQLDRGAESSGYRFAAGPFGGSLRDDETTRFGFPIVQGAEFTVLAACDNDCSDLDMRAYDAAGRLVVQDNDLDAVPQVLLSSTQNEIAYIEMIMANCSQAPCYWQAKVFYRNSDTSAGAK